MTAAPKPNVVGEDAETFGDWLREARESFERVGGGIGITQEDTAKLLGLSHQVAVSNIETGKTSLPPSRWGDVERLLNASIPDDLRRREYAWRCERLLDETGASLTDIANLLGVSTRTVRGWREGRNLPKMKRVQMIADAYDVSAATVSRFG